MTSQADTVSLARAALSGDRLGAQSTVKNLCATSKSKKLVEKLQHLLDRHAGLPPGTDDLFWVQEPQMVLDDLVLEYGVRSQLLAVVDQHKYSGRLRQYGLKPERRIVLTGTPGTGKTASAEALASELGFPLLTVRQDKVVSSYLGETAKNLSKLWEALRTKTAVYLLDECDSIGSSRSLTDSSAASQAHRQSISQLFQLMDRDDSDSVLVLTTNMPDLLDPAFRRRVDRVIRYDDLGPDEAEELAVKTANKVALPLESLQDIPSNPDEIVRMVRRLATDRLVALSRHHEHWSSDET